jgi:ribosomal protein S12 methylthiotransferase accessory factor
VVRVLIPGLAPNFASAFPFQGRGRLRQAAVDLGWRDTPLAEDEINLFPLAHA